MGDKAVDETIESVRKLYKILDRIKETGAPTAGDQAFLATYSAEFGDAIVDEQIHNAGKKVTAPIEKQATKPAPKTPPSVSSLAQTLEAYIAHRETSIYALDRKARLFTSGAYTIMRGNMPTVEKLGKIADALGCSMDDLLRGSPPEQARPMVREKGSPRPLAETIAAYAKMNDMNIYMLEQKAMESGLKPGALANIIYKRSLNPQVSTLYPIAEALGITLDQLVAGPSEAELAHAQDKKQGQEKRIGERKKAPEHPLISPTERAVGKVVDYIKKHRVLGTGVVFTLGLLPTMAGAAVVEVAKKLPLSPKNQDITGAAGTGIIGGVIARFILKLTPGGAIAIGALEATAVGTYTATEHEQRWIGSLPEGKQKEGAKLSLALAQMGLKLVTLPVEFVLGMAKGATTSIPSDNKLEGVAMNTLTLPARAVGGLMKAAEESAESLKRHGKDAVNAAKALTKNISHEEERNARWKAIAKQHEVKGEPSPALTRTVIPAPDFLPSSLTAPSSSIAHTEWREPANNEVPTTRLDNMATTLDAPYVKTVEGLRDASITATSRAAEQAVWAAQVGASQHTSPATQIEGGKKLDYIAPTRAGIVSRAEKSPSTSWAGGGPSGLKIVITNPTWVGEDGKPLLNQSHAR